MLIAASTYTTGQFIGAFISLVIWIGFIAWTVSIAKRKGRSAFGWGLFAFFFSVIALIVVAIMPSRRPT